MEALVDHEHGPTVLIACLVVVLAIHLLWKIAEKTIESHQDKSKELESKLDRFSGILSSYMTDIIQLSDKMTDVEKRLSELIEVEHKIRRLNRAVKTLAGDQWDEIKRSVDDDLP
jgi:DNA repair ATPase RecN